MKALQHFKTITYHKYLVMKGCFAVGLYRQGICHDLSKYSWTEFRVGAKYYQGNRSPNNAEREDIGYSSAWLHHKGRNRHHYEYWVAAAIGSLKGPRHGGANIKVVKMFEEMKEEVHDWKDDEEISRYLARLLNKDAFDHAGLIYGVGHAVYSKSDPRAVIFKGFVERLSEEKGLHDEFELYNSVERLAPAVIAKERQMYKGVSVNVDFYSGFVYKMLGLPMELYTPIFAIARMVGWSAHRMEELATNSKIIRPAYKTLCTDQPYVELSERK